MRVSFADGKIELHTHYEERERAKAAGAYWNKKRKVWTLEPSKLSIYTLRGLGDSVISNRNELDAIDSQLDGARNGPGLYPSERVIVSREETPRYPHQASAQELLLNRKRLALFIYMGGGKTRTVLDAIQTAFVHKEIARTALIVAPLSILHVWENEASKWLTIPFHLVRVAGGTNEKRYAMQEVREYRGDGLLLVLTNYESLIERERRTAVDAKAEPKKETEPASKERHDFFTDISWEFVVADESTRLAHRRTKTTDAMIEIADRANFVAALTGTPVANTFMDLYAQMRFVDRRCFGASLARFRDRYAVMGGWRGKEVTALRNDDEFWNTVRAFSYIVKADQLNLPEKHNQTRLVTLSGDQLDAYKEAEEEFLFWVEKISKLPAKSEEVMILVRNALTRLTKLAQICAGFIYDPSGRTVLFNKNAKLKELDALLDEMGNDKAVIFTRFTEEVRQTHDLLTGRDWWSGYIDGSVPAGERESLIAAFRNARAPAAMVVQIQAGGYGIDLSFARVGIYTSNLYTPAARDQSESRIWRPPATDPKTFIDLIAKGTVDETIAAALAAKKSVAEVLFKDVPLQGELVGLQG